ncbi:MAG: hypothetical protein IKU45_06435 [Clostridia bacterium]|nr:hypothetical protein [Clostridia bacterium]
MNRTATTGEFHFPKDGAMLTYAAGERVGDDLKIIVRFSASHGRNLELNGVPMTNYDHCLYKSEFILNEYKNTIDIVDTASGEKWSIDVYLLRKGYKKYRFSLDDNIWFLQNLNENKDVYKSMFEDPYLALLKAIHDKHGSTFHVNIYYETPRHGGFNLSQMTDKYKDEWKANSDWLRLSFHANADKPNRPYICSTYEQAYFEMDRVNKEILRFAGEEAFAKTVTTIHWGETSVEAAKAFRDLGVKAFVASYNYNRDGIMDLRMYCNAEQCALLQKYGYYYDKEMDIYLFRYNGGIQRAKPEWIPQYFDAQVRECPRYEFKDICLHEAYFYPEYQDHIPDYYEKLDAAATWCDEHGYEPIFMDELFEFNTH